MKRIIVLTMLMLIATMSLAAAADECTCGDGTPLKFETGIPEDLDFEDVSVGDTFELEIPDYPGNYVTIEITEVKDESEAIAFSWTSDIPVCSVLVKAGQGEETTSVDGATSGEGEAPETSNNAAISHITFCFGDDGNVNVIPEFPTLALPVAAILGLAFLFQRRKE